jgi:hypothetical protein
MIYLMTYTLCESSRILFIKKYLTEWVNSPHIILQSALPSHQYIMTVFLCQKL